MVHMQCPQRLRSCEEIAKIFFLVCLALLLAGGDAYAKKKGVKGRYLVVDDGVSLRDYVGAIVILEQAEIISDKDKPVDTEDVRATSDGMLREKLGEAGIFGDILSEIPLDAPKGRAIIKIKTRLTIQHGSRAARFIIGFGAGKSKLHIRIDFIDAKTGKHLAMFNGYGTGMGIMSFQAGGVQRMSRDDLQENYAKLVRLLLDEME